MFIPAEVEEHRYLFRPLTYDEYPPGNSSTTRTKVGNSSGSSASERSHCRSSSTVQVLFRYNPLHDLESLWWVAVYFVVGGTLRVFPPRGINCAEDCYSSQPWYAEEISRMKVQRRIADSLFITRDMRSTTMTSYAWFSSDMTCLPCSFRGIGETLAAMRHCLVIRYRQAEEDCTNICLRAGYGLYDVFSQLLLEVYTLMQSSGDITVTPL